MGESGWFLHTVEVYHAPRHAPRVQETCGIDENSLWMFYIPYTPHQKKCPAAGGFKITAFICIYCRGKQTFLTVGNSEN